MAAKDVQLDLTPAEVAQELAKARSRIAELESNASQPPSFAVTDAREIDAGKDADDVQWWWYKIDLPASGGIEIKICGVPYYHGEQYKVTTATLQTLKDIVFRSWSHEAQIKGNNENFYRQPKNLTLRGSGR